MNRDRFYDGAERIAQRYAKRQFLANDLLLPFQLMSSPLAREALQLARAEWTVADLAAFDDELDDPAKVSQHERRIELLRSEVDPSSIEFEADEEARGVIVRIAPLPEARAEIERTAEAQRRLESAMGLSNWVMKSRDLRAADPSMTIAAAIAVAKELEASLELDNDLDAFLWSTMRNGAIVGTASIAARFGEDTEFDCHQDWVTTRIVAGCTIQRSLEDEAMLVDDACFSMTPSSMEPKG